MTSQTGTQKIEIQILVDMSRSKGNPKTKLVS